MSDPTKDPSARAPAPLCAPTSSRDPSGDDRLLSCSHREFSELSTADWRSIADRLLSLLAQELDTPLQSTGVALPEPGDVQPGITLSLQSESVDSSGLEVRLEGVLGGQSEPERASFSATLFMFVGGIRVTGTQADHYELELQQTGSGVRWRRIGWTKDLYGEFEGVKVWGDISR